MISRAAIVILILSIVAYFAIKSCGEDGGTRPWCRTANGLFKRGERLAIQLFAAALNLTGASVASPSSGTTSATLTLTQTNRALREAALAKLSPAEKASRTAQRLYQVGIIWFAPILSRSGYGSEAIDFVKELDDRFDDRFAIAQHGDSFSQEFVAGLPPPLLRRLGEMFDRTSWFGRPHIAICHSEPGAWEPSLWPTEPCPSMNSVYSIGRTMFETDRIPEGWPMRLGNMDEIWVPTTFHKEIFAQNGVDPSKLFVVPEAVDIEFFDPAKYQRKSLLSMSSSVDEDQPFIFFSIFKWEDRKGWDVLLKAYLREFSNTNDKGRAALVILTHEYHSDEENSPERQMRQLIDSEVAQGFYNLEEVALVKVIDEHVPTSSLPVLYRSSDAFVIPPHGEGWGRPHVEAMAMELPLLATNWSGPTEFMTEENAFPIAIEDALVPVGKGPFKDHMWAQPSIDHLRKLMRFVVENPDKAKEKGKKARADMVSRFSPEKLGDLIESHLLRILSKFEIK